MAKAFINDENLTDIADAIRATLDESRQYLPSEMAAAIQSIPIMAQLNRKKYFQSVPAGAASGYATIEQIEGNTVAWNNNTRNNITGTLVTKTGDIYTVSGSTSAYNGVAQVGTSKPVEGHKYYLSAFVTQNSCGTRMFFNPNPSNMGANALIVPIGRTGLYHTIVTISSAASQVYIWQTYSAFDGIFGFYPPSIIDLTAIFGAGNEPTTVADFEAWMAQNIGTLPYYDYNAGELLSVKMSGMQTQDSNQQTLDTIALDVTTITGINTSTNVREVIFADGMKQADREGTVKDTLDLRSDTATVNVGSRAYQSGDESDTSVITDGTTTYYALTTPIEYTDLQDANGNPLNPRYKVEQGGTEQMLPVNTSTPTTVAPTLTTTYKKNI